MGMGGTTESYAMAAEAGAAAGAGRGDARIAFITDRLQKAFPAVRADKFTKAWADSENL